MQLHRLFRLPQMFSDSDKRRGREDGKRDERQALFLEALGGMFAEKQVGGWVMREDSWQVQGRVTAKRRWQ